MSLGDLVGFNWPSISDHPFHPYPTPPPYCFLKLYINIFETIFFTNTIKINKNHLFSMKKLSHIKHTRNDMIYSHTKIILNENFKRPLIYKTP